MGGSHYDIFEDMSYTFKASKLHGGKRKTSFRIHLKNKDEKVRLKPLEILWFDTEYLTISRKVAAKYDLI